MPKFNNTQDPFSLLKQAKYLLLLLSAVLIIANLYFLSATRQHAHSYSEQQNQATWFLLQLTKEFTELNTTIPLSANNDEYRDRTLLKYELTWSRFDLLLTSDEADSFISLPGARNFFNTLFSNFQSLEPRLIAAQTPEQAARLGLEFDVLYDAMIKYINTHFRVQSPTYIKQQTTAQNLNKVQLASMILLVFCVILVTYILQKEAEYHKQQSLTDSLTGIGNRLSLFNQLKYRIFQKKSFQLFLLDLNDFKQVNDQYGHQAGDKVLKVFAERLSQVEANCYRIGGDEFAIISRPLDEEEVSRTTIKIQHLIRETIYSANNVLHISTSIGSAQYPADAEKLNELMQIADKDMYKDKNQAKAIADKIA